MTRQTPIDTVEEMLAYSEGVAAQMIKDMDEEEAISPDQYLDAFADFLKQYSRATIEAILAGHDELAPYPVPLCMQYLLDHNPVLGAMLLQHPKKLMSLAHGAIERVQQEWLEMTSWPPLLPTWSDHFPSWHENPWLRMLWCL